MTRPARAVREVYTARRAPPPRYTLMRLMYTLRRRAVAVVVLAAMTLTAVAVPAGAGTPSQAVPRGGHEPSVVVRWNAALVEAVRRTGFRPRWTARALAIVHTAMYDAWRPTTRSRWGCIETATCAARTRSATRRTYAMR